MGDVVSIVAAICAILGFGGIFGIIKNGTVLEPPLQNGHVAGSK